MARVAAFVRIRRACGHTFGCVGIHGALEHGRRFLLLPQFDDEVDVLHFERAVRLFDAEGHDDPARFAVGFVGRIDVYAVALFRKRAVLRLAHVFDRIGKALGQNDVFVEVEFKVLARFDAVRLCRAAVIFFAAPKIAAPRLIDARHGHEHGIPLARILGEYGRRNRLVQQIAEIIGHIIFRSIADRPVPHVRAARTVAAARHADERILPERIQ